MRDAGVSTRGSKEIRAINMSESAYSKLPANSGTPTVGEVIDATVPHNLATQAISTSAQFFTANSDAVELNRPELQWNAQDEIRKATFTSGGDAVAHPEFLASLGRFSNSPFQQQAGQYQAISTPAIEDISSQYDPDYPPYSIHQAATIMEASGHLFSSAHRLTRALANRRYAVGGEPQERLAHVDGVHTSSNKTGGTGEPPDSGVDSVFEDFDADGLTCSGIEAIFDDFANAESAGEVVDSAGEVVNIDISDASR